jgi:hypothetical protein
MYVSETSESFCRWIRNNEEENMWRSSQSFLWWCALFRWILKTSLNIILYFCRLFLFFPSSSQVKWEQKQCCQVFRFLYMNWTKFRIHLLVDVSREHWNLIFNIHFANFSLFICSPLSHDEMKVNDFSNFQSIFL